jgi:hypothetical protein
VTATLAISPGECETLHRLLVRRFIILSERGCELAQSEGASFEQLVDSSGDDLRLFEEVGLEFLGAVGDPKGAKLTMPAERLAATTGRLGEDAMRALAEGPDWHEPEERDEARCKRFLDARETYDEMLEHLDAGREASSV